MTDLAPFFKFRDESIKFRAKLEIILYQSLPEPNKLTSASHGVYQRIKQNLTLIAAHMEAAILNPYRESQEYKDLDLAAVQREYVAKAERHMEEMDKAQWNQSQFLPESNQWFDLFQECFHKLEKEKQDGYRFHHTRLLISETNWLFDMFCNSSK